MRFAVISGSVLGIQVYRGFAPLSRLAEISRPDVYDQDSNPLGTQREIKINHARGAYEYIAGENRMSFFPEIVLNARNPDVIRFLPSASGSPLGYLEIDESKLSPATEKMISRVDGNHRLHFANGDKQRRLPPACKEVGFCLVSGLTQEQEARLFLDINSNQKGMNTSHLDNLKYRLTPQHELIEKHFALFVAERLCRDPKGPFLGFVHKGGRKGTDNLGRSQGLKRHVSLRSLHGAISKLLRTSRYLQLIPSGDPRYVVIREYWNSVRRVFSTDWSAQKDSLLLKGIGITAMALIGAEVIDRCLLAKDASQDRMRAYLTSVARLADWSAQGEFAGYSGLQGAERAARQLREGLARDEDYGELVTTLEKQL